jgi:hypothetical protein
MLNGGSVVALSGLVQKRSKLLKAFVVSASVLLVLSSCVAPPLSPLDGPPNDEMPASSSEVTTEAIRANPLKTRCEEIVSVSAYAFGIGTRDSTGPFGGGGRVRWKVDDSRYERDSDLDTAGEGVICFRSGLIRQLENGTQKSIVDVREALEASEFGLESLAYIPIADLMSLATFLFTVQNGQEVLFDAEALIASAGRSPLDLAALEVNPFESDVSLADSPPIAGDPCQSLGKSVQSNGSILECRYVAGMELAYSAVSGALQVPRMDGLGEPLDVCRIRDKRSSAGGGATGFPFRGERMRVDGQLDLAIIPIDFLDAPANVTVHDFVDPQVERFMATFEMWAGDNELVKWHIPDEWLRMPKESKYYQWDHSTIQGDGTLKPDSNTQLMSVAEQQYDIFSEAEKVLDLSEVDYAYVIANPNATQILFAPYSHDRRVKTAQGLYNFPHYGFGTTITGNWSARGWTALWHEMLHFRGVTGHAPGNEFPYNLMAAGETLNVWDAFLLGWHDEEQLLCFDANNLTSQTFQLGAMELPVEGARGAVIKIDETSALVLETRRKGAHNDLIPKGFAGLQVYLVDSSKVAQRYDGNIEREKDYFAYHLRIDSLDHKAISAVPQLFAPGYPDLNETAFPGDSFTYRGVRIEYLEGGDFDLIRISADNGVLPASHQEKVEYEQMIYLHRKAESKGICGCCGCFPEA